MTFVKGLHSTYSVDDEVMSKGGVGSIHRTDSPAFVYKKYLRPEKVPGREELDRLIGIGREVLIAARREPGETPESSVNWPVDLVTDAGGRTVGIVLPAIPLPLFHAEHRVVQGLEFLIMARARPPAARARIALLLRMAEILAFVNARGLVHGDVNGKNLAWSIRPHPIMYLIDCDGMVPQSPPPTRGVQALGWTDPRLVERRIPAHDQYSDWYALALAMYRGLLLKPGVLERRQDKSWPGPSQIPANLPAPVTALLRRGLDPLDHTVRPTPEEWVSTLVATYLPAGDFNENAAALDAISPIHRETPGFTQLPDVDWTEISTDRQMRPPSPPPPIAPRPPPIAPRPPPIAPRPPPIAPSRPGPAVSLPTGKWIGVAGSSKSLVINRDGTYRLEVAGKIPQLGRMTLQGTRLILRVPGLIPTPFRWVADRDRLTLVRVSDGLVSEYQRDVGGNVLVGAWVNRGDRYSVLQLGANDVYRLEVSGRATVAGAFKVNGVDLILDHYGLPAVSYRWWIANDRLNLQRSGQPSSQFSRAAGPLKVPGSLVGGWMTRGGKPKVLTFDEDATYQLAPRASSDVFGRFEVSGAQLTLRASGLRATQYEWAVSNDRLDLRRDDGTVSTYWRIP